MKISQKFSIVFLVFIMLLTVLYFLFADNIGISAKNLEKDARLASKTDDSWLAVTDVGEELGGVLLYNEECDDWNYHVYLNRPGLDYGYHFRAGGSVPEIENNVGVYSFDGADEQIIMSMNNAKIEKIAVSGRLLQTIDIDSDKPFVLVMPEGCNFSFYDVNKQEIEYNKRF